MQGQGAKQAMKFNIKNRPQPKDFPANKTRHLGVDMTAWKKADDEWFEGFEKQLRKELRDMYRSAETKQLIKEILGDEP
jgi:hypothetical protein